MTVTDTHTDTATLPTVAETIAAVRAGHIAPVDAHPTRDPAGRLVHTLGWAAAAVSATVLPLYWWAGDPWWQWATALALLLTGITLLALAEEQYRSAKEAD